LKKPVFCEGVHRPAESTAAAFDFAAGRVTYAGRVKRNAILKPRRIVNKSFVAFWTGVTDAPLPSGYDMIPPSRKNALKSIMKYDKPQPVVDEECWQLASEQTYEHFRFYMQNSKLVSMEDALATMDKGTSPGYPWNISYSTKQRMIDNVDVPALLNEYWEHYQNISPIWTCSQKIEMRTVEKIRDGRIRTFTASPLELSVAMSQYCLDQNNRFYQSAMKTSSFVGHTTFSGAFQQIYDKLTEGGVRKIGFDTDIKDFDASVSRRMLEDQRDRRWRFMHPSIQDDPEHKARFYHMYDEIIHSYIVLENGDLIQKHSGNPSGSVNTIVDNTMTLDHLLRYAWLVFTKEAHFKIVAEQSAAQVVSDVPDPWNRAFFERTVKYVLCGDDNIMTVEPDRIKNPYDFTGRSVRDVWASLGIVATSDDWEGRPVELLQFLSQSFCKVGRMYLPSPDTDKVLCSLLYNSKIDDVRWHYYRALALRLQGWPNMKLRAILDDYISYIQDTHRNELTGAVSVNKDTQIDFEDLLHTWKSDRYMYAMYTGLEASSGGAASQFSL